MPNHWISLEETLFAEWELIFPSPANDADVMNILNFACELLKAGDENDIYRVQKKIGFVSMWKTMWEKEEMLPLFDLGISENYKLLNLTSGRICYYDKDDRIIKSEVDNIGTLLKDLRPLEAKDRSVFMENVGPVTILSRSVSKREFLGINDKPPKEVRFQISLRTDIWFPKVLGLIEGDQPFFPNPPKWYDNSTLAFCHTPRLNRFLSKIHQLTLDMGGKWSLSEPEGIAILYGLMVGKDSILLESSPKRHLP